MHTASNSQFQPVDESSCLIFAEKADLFAVSDAVT